jgi:hypothetical protein
VRDRVFCLQQRSIDDLGAASAQKTAEKQLKDENGNSGSDNRRF